MTQSELLDQLLELAEMTSSSDSFYQVKGQIAKWFQQILGVPWLQIHMLVRNEQRTMEIAATAGHSETGDRLYPAGELLLFDSLPSYMQDSFIRGARIEVKDLRTSAIADQDVELAAEENLVAAICFPLIARASVVGLLIVYANQTPEWDETLRRVANAVLLLTANLIDRDCMLVEQEELHEQLEQVRHTDLGTGLYNRRYFNRALHIEVSRAQRYRRPLACLMFEIDGFQAILDNYGPSIADPVLQEFARLLKAASRESDVLCYQGNGRFALLAVETSEVGALVLGSRLLELICERPFSYGSHTLEVTASAGVSSMPNPHLQSMEQMLDATENALFDAIRRGGNRLEAVEPGS